MDTRPQQTQGDPEVSTQDYWAQVQALREQLAQLRPQGART